MSAFQGQRPGPPGGRASHSQGRPRGDQGFDSVVAIWPDYLKGGYFDAQGNLRIEYVSREKVEPLARAMSALTTHQVRRFFGHCRAIETRLKSGATSWDAVWPEVKKLDVAAADGAAKKPPKIPRVFQDFIQRNVAAISQKKDFLEGFLPHFEALVGFGQAYFKKERT